ncbi:phosphatase PAP2 family protein [Clostridioides difficile]
MEFNLNTIKINNKIEIKVLDLVWLIIIPIININYFIASILTKNGHNITTSIDNKIRFNSIFVIPYVYWYVYIIVGFIIILIRSRQDYIKVFLSFFIGMCICYIFYYIYPTEITRPIVENNNILNVLVNNIYSADKPVNCFPSLHVLTTYFIMRYTKYKDSRKVFYYTQIVGVLIILSTVFIKQHFVLDIIGAIILCEIVMLFIKRVDDNKINRILDIPYKIKDKIVVFISNKNQISSKDIINEEKREEDEVLRNK